MRRSHRCFASRRFAAILSLATTGGCIDNLHQIAGTGAVYTSACAADMLPQGLTYEAQCEPPPCVEGYTTAPVSHRVVALDPGRKIVGVAERVCIQDLARASGLFNPAMMPPEVRPGSPGEAPPTP